MELVGAISAREWSSQNGIYSLEFDHDDNQLMASHDSLLADRYAIDQNYHQFTIGASSLGCPLPIFSAYGGSTSHFSPGNFFDSYSSYSTFSQRSTSNNPDDHPVTLVKSNSSPLALCEGDIFMRNSDLFVNIEGGHHHQLLNQDFVGNGNYGGNNQSAMSHNVTIHEEHSPMGNGSRYSSNNYLKRSRSTPLTPAEYGQGPKNKRNVKSRKTSTKKLAMSDNEIDEDGNAKGPLSPNSSYSAGEQSNASHEEHGGLASSSIPKGSPAPKFKTI